MDKFEDSNKRKVPFKMPEGYFNDLSSRVMDKIEEDEKPAKKSIVPMFKTFMWLAATFVLVFGVGRVIVPLVIDPSQKLQHESATQVVVNDNVSASDFVDDIDELDLSDEDIIEYLSDQNIDNDFLISEL